MTSSWTSFRVSLAAALAGGALFAAELAEGQSRRGFSSNDAAGRAQAEAERRRKAFEDAMRKIEEAERAQEAARQAEEARAAAARLAQEQLRSTVDAVATEAGGGAAEAADLKRSQAEAFATAAAAKTPEDVRENFSPDRTPSGAGEPPPAGETPVPSETAPDGAGEPSKDKQDGPKETVIDADGRVIFDGSGRFGKEYQVVIFEDNVVVNNPGFVMNSDRLTAYFKQKPKPAAAAGSVPESGAAGAEAEGGNQLERAVATGREVVVTKKIADGDPQIAKARKATYFAARDEVMLEIWPQVQRGKNLVIAKSKDTIIILKGDEMIVNGPVRTQIANEKKPRPAGTPAGSEEGGADGRTVIDAKTGAIFNRPSATKDTREMFFEGEVKVADPGFDIFCKELTAYVRKSEEGSELYKTVAVGDKVEVQRQTSDGEVQVGRAGRVTHLASNGDVIMEIWPEIERAGHSGVARYRDARIVLKADGDVESRGVETKIVQDGKSLTFGSGRGG